MVHSWMIDAMDADEQRKNTPTEVSPLHQAIVAGNSRRALELLRTCSVANLQTREPQFLKSPLHEAAARGMSEVVEALLGAGVPPDPPDDSGQSPLHEAAYGGHLKVVQLLVEKKVHLDRQPHSMGMQTPLILAIKQKHLAVVEFLLSSGASSGKQDKWGKDAFAHARDAGDPQILASLMATRVPKPR